MEQRLFLAACVMYAFTLVTRYLKKHNKLATANAFGWWHASFLFLIILCAAYLLLFVMRGGTGDPVTVSQIIGSIVCAAACAGCGYAAGQKANAKKQESIMKTDLEWSNTVYFAGFVASVVMFFFIQAFKIPSASMHNTLLEGDHLFVNKAVYGFRIPLTDIRFGASSEIKPGDIIVFQFPAKDRQQQNCGGSQYGKDFVKRVIAMPGDTVQVVNGRPIVNGTPVPEQPYELYQSVERLPYEAPEDPEQYQQIWEEHQLDNYLGFYLRDSFGPVVVPDNTYFVMGDNRDDSCDSRFWGPVPRENIKGKAWFIHWPLNRIGLIK